MERSIRNAETLTAFKKDKKRLLMLARIVIALYVLLILCSALGIVSAIYRIKSLSYALAGGWVLLLIGVRCLKRFSPSVKSLEPYRFEIARPEDYLCALEARAGLRPLPGSSGYADFMRGKEHIFLLKQACKDTDRLAADRKALYRLIPEGEKPDKQVGIQNRLVQLVFVATESDSAGLLLSNVQTNADQLSSRAVPFVKVALDKRAHALYVPALAGEGSLGDLKSYFAAVEFCLFDITPLD